MGFTLQLADDGSISRPVLSPPDTNAHKYSRGHAAIHSGPALHTGASRLSAKAALAIGAGLVTICGDTAALTEQAAHVTAIMLHDGRLDDMLDDPRVTACAIGPGAGKGKMLRDVILATLERQRPLVLDADGLTTFEDHPPTLFAKGHPDVVLTPHVGEFGRLFPDIALDDRQAAALRAAKTSHCVVLLKGPETWIAAPDGRCAVNRHSSPWLAIAGSGDVLTGIICGLLAQGVPAFDAACIGAWLHGDLGVRGGPGLTADNMLGHIPLVLRGCLHDAQQHGARFSA